MLTYEPARVEQYDEFLQLMRNHTANYLERTMELMQMTWQQFVHLFRTVGQVYGIYEDDQLAGFYWIEEREKVLHLHGLVLTGQFQGEGIGTQVLKMLESMYRGSMDAIELGVHKCNEKARVLYERLGYETVKRLDDLGFYIMQKRLSPGPSPNAKDCIRSGAKRNSGHNLVNSGYKASLRLAQIAFGKNFRYAPNVIRHCG